ncbi:hypothetical protein GF314_02575 [bacterium]|nr:hypothetical protein [bacterium]
MAMVEGKRKLIVNLRHRVPDTARPCTLAGPRRRLFARRIPELTARSLGGARALSDPLYRTLRPPRLFPLFQEGPVSELQRDELHRTWVVMAPERAGRPRDVVVTVSERADHVCPFCPGHEHRTLNEIAASGRGPGARGVDGWRVRVVPNLYPAVTPPLGTHEVVVLSPDHHRGLADLSGDEVADALHVVRERLRALAAQEPPLRPLFFLNSGAAAGASLRHPHGQILATADEPPVMATELAAMTDWRRRHGGCLLCHEADRARPEGRLVGQGRRCQVQAPVASRYAWELRFQPEAHAARFEEASEEIVRDLAGLVAGACRALREVAGDPAYNLALHSAPEGEPGFHWHLELTPRLAPMAGFEIGSGVHINSVLPQVAAASLREAMDPDLVRGIA